MGTGVMMAMMAGSTIMGISGDIFEGEADAQQAEWNAAMSEYEGKYAQQKAAVEEGMLRQDVERTVGTATAAAGASGFATGSISSQAAIDEIVKSGEIDAALIRHEGDIGKWRGKVSSDMYNIKADASRTAGKFNAATTMLSGVSQIASYRKYGGPFEKKTI